ncbi:MAG: class I SAM-dependent methyltransferase [Actinomycetota bacterium]
MSWFQSVPSVSLELVTELGIPPGTAVVDVGGGASGLAGSLLDRGFSDVSVLDVSSAALDAAREGIGGRPGVHWVQHDLLTWEPQRRYGLWHDRAVFHFLVDREERDRYLQVLSAAVEPAGHVIVATFAPDGPQRCSGLPVAPYGPEELSRLLRDRVDVVAARREEHVTPGGTIQPFTWIAGRVRL